MGVSIEVYRQRIGSFARVATVSPSLGSFARVATVLPSLRGHKRNTCCNPKQSKDFGTVLPVIIGFSCLVVLVAAIIPSSSLVLDLTQFGGVEKNPGPKSGTPNEELNFFKFASIVLNEFPEALRRIFVDVWDKRIAPLHGNQVWDDSTSVRILFFNSKGPKTQIPINKSFKDWDCTALFQAILHAKTFALPDPLTPSNKKTLYELFLKNRAPIPGPFHSSVASPSADQNETTALAVDQLRHLRNTLCHSSSNRVDKVTFDGYVKYAKDAFTAVNLCTNSLETIGTFPTLEFEQLKERINKERIDFNQFLQSEVNSKLENIKVTTDETNKNVSEIKKEMDEQKTKDVGMGDIENQCGQSTADNNDDITALKGILSNEYKRRAIRLHPLPWLDTTQFELDKVFTKLNIIQRENERSKLTNKTVDLSDIFDNHEHKSVNPRIILIEGSPGMGKTTLSLKLAHDWAMGKMPEKFPPIELVFLIKCRDMKGDIIEAINEQLLPLEKRNLKTKLRKFIEEQQHKILLVVDGLDETPEGAEKDIINLLARKFLQKCYVVATSRQEKGLQVRKYFDTLLEIKGYSEKDINLYIYRYFGKKQDLADQLIENLLKDSRLQTLATNPLNTVLLCVVFEDYDGQLPSTVTELYNKIVLCITKRYRERHALEVEDKVIETYKETLGKLAYKGLLEDSLSFRESDLNVDKIQCTEVGFLYKEVSKRKIEPDHTYWFVHKTFQEYLVAFYFTNTIETVDDMVEKLKDTGKFMQVLMFVSGMLRKKDAVQCRNFVKKLGTVLVQNMDKNKVVGILCAVLSESFVDEDMARIIYQFLPENLLAIKRETPYGAYVAKTLPGILNLLCTGDGVYQVHFKELLFGMNEVSTSDLRLICKALKEKLKVRKLDLIYCEINNEGTRALADMLSDNTTLKELWLMGNNLNREGAEILRNGLSQNTTLRRLYVSGNNLGDGGVKAITATLTHDTSFKDMAARNFDDGDKEDDKRGSALHILGFVTTKCGENGASAVADMLRTNKILTALVMEDNPLGCRGVTHLAKALKLNNTLQCLFLAETDCGNEGAVAIADMLYINETLTNLYLGNYPDSEEHKSNKVGKDGAVALAGALRVNKSLRELHLRNNDITDEGLKCLIEALLVNTTLNKLCINYPGDGSRRLENDEPLKKKRRAEGRITWDCDCCLRNAENK